MDTVHTGELLPDEDGAVLEILVHPDCAFASGTRHTKRRTQLTESLVITCIGMPIDVLSYRPSSLLRTVLGFSSPPGAACRSMTV